MQYVSTRGADNKLSFSDALLTGLAEDGGLFMPLSIPKIDSNLLDKWRDLSYVELATAIMKNFIGDWQENDLQNIIANSYARDIFPHCEVTPLLHLKNSNFSLLQLAQGPSLAFKDVAMQFLGQAFNYELKRRNEKINILGATSGDTGSAAEYALRDKENINVFMLSPHGRMSPFQQAQMYTIDAANIYNIAIRGVFDDCQDLVKKINNDEAFKKQWNIGAVNSINWARILAQIVYYFKAYFSLQLTPPTMMNVAVPSGNFGNIFAAFMAKKMGLPIKNLLLASNENDVLYDFFNTGIYRVRRAAEIAATSSPSMDIGKASNFERYLYLLCDRNAAQVRKWLQDIEEKGQITLDANWQQKVRDDGFVAGRSDHAARLQTISKVFQQDNVIIDPHTADGVHVASNWMRQHDDETPMVCLETASPIKFAKTVEEALGTHVAYPKQFANIENLPQHLQIIANDAAQLKEYLISKLAK